MKQYPEYQDVSSSIWLSKIPAHWQYDKMKYTFSEHSEKGHPDEPLLVASQNMGVVPKNVYGSRTVEAQKDLHLLKFVSVGDFVISLRSFQGGIEYAYYQGIISPAYTILTPNNSSCTEYFKYLLKSRDFISLLKLCVTGIREGQNIDYGKLRDFKLPVPPREEQDQIVRFLDWKVSEINRLINIKRKEINLLEEQVAVFISDIITHGSTHNRDMKPCEIEWIGKIPTHWNVMRCKYLFSERDERSIDGKETHLSMSQKYGLVPDEQLDERRMLSESYAGGKICYTSDLVLNRLKAHLGVFALATQLGVISPDYTVLIPHTTLILPEFAEMVLKSLRCRRELKIRVRGVTEGFWRLYTDDFNTISIPVPPLGEQRQIMDAVSSYSDKIKQYKICLTKEIEVLQELKTRLISDAVTGKIDVRGVEIPEYEYIAEENINDQEMGKTENQEDDVNE